MSDNLVDNFKSGFAIPDPVGSQFVHQTTDGGNSWTVISPDLSTKAKLHRKISAFAPEIGKSDFKPTVSQYEVNEMHTEKLASCQK